MKPFAFLLRAFVAPVFALACRPPAQADVVLEWNDTLRHLAAEPMNALPPAVQVRTFAMTHLAMHNAAAAAARSGDPRLGLQRGALAVAAADVLEQIWPRSVASVTALAARQLDSLDRGMQEQARRIGRLAAAEVIQQRLHDGWADLAAANPLSGPAPHDSVSTANAIARGAPPPKSPWLALKPFLLKNATQFQAAPAFTVTHQGAVIVNTALRFSRLFNTVNTTLPGGTLQGTWAEEPLVSWNRVAHAAAASANLDPAAEARLFAGLNLALADAFLTAEHWRFHWGTWRSITVEKWEEIDARPVMPGEVIVQAHDGFDTRPVRLKTVPLLLPPQPNFPSVAATMAGAAQAALAAFWKTDRLAFSFSMPPSGAAAAESPPALRHFSGFAEAAREAAFVASLDGRHGREACVSGFQLGAAIGSHLARRLPAPRR